MKVSHHWIGCGTATDFCFHTWPSGLPDLTPTSFLGGMLRMLSMYHTCQMMLKNQDSASSSSPPPLWHRERGTWERAWAELDYQTDVCYVILGSYAEWCMVTRHDLGSFPNLYHVTVGSLVI